ncbi:MAG: hypothetical protein ONB06_10920 [candidate division KSB1 bacterium]|nr:hypothetical protein [candidate division KSB1 bacterium]
MSILANVAAVLLRNPLLILLLAAAWAADGAALVVVERDFRELVERAEVIVEGTVTRVEESPDASGVQRTLVTLSDLAVHKGADLGEEFVLDVVGGTKNGLRSAVLALPSFAPGDRVILFVRGNGQAVFPVVGVHQGYFRVEQADDGEPRVMRCDGQPVLGREQRRLRFVPRSNSGVERAVTLDVFRSWIRDELQQLGGGVP